MRTTKQKPRKMSKAERAARARRAAEKWWSWAYLTMHQLVIDVERLDQEVGKPPSPLSDAIDGDYLTALIEHLRDALGQMALCYPRPPLPASGFGPDPLAGVR